MSVLIVLPAMAQAAGPFRRAVEAARGRSDAARAVCVINAVPNGLLSGGAGALDKIADALASQMREKADAAIESLVKRAGRIGLELDASVVSGDLAEFVVERVATSRVDYLILIRPKSMISSREVDRAVEALDEFDGEVIVIK